MPIKRSPNGTSLKIRYESAVNSNTEEALNEILSGKLLDVAAWDKIYSRELFDNIRFPVGENNEDIAVFYKIVDSAGKVAHTGTTEYFYLSRPGSITKLKYSNEQILYW